MKIGLYFGTFNPVHVGHLIIANHMVEFSDIDEVWFVVTPQSPHKKSNRLGLIPSVSTGLFSSRGLPKTTTLRYRI